MLAQNRIRRHGYHLMSLASLGMVALAGVGLLTSAMPWFTHWNPTWLSGNLGGLDWEQAQAMNRQGKALLSLAGIVWTLAYLVPLVALRRLGDRLYRHEALTRPVADAFLWLAHSLPAFALLSVAATTLTVYATVAGSSKTTFNLDFSGIYLFLVACLGLYSVAHIMRLASEAADDSRSIV